MGSTSCSSDEVEDDEYRNVSDVLLALEKAAQTPNVHRVDLRKAFQMEKLNAFQNIYGGDEDPFADNTGGGVVNAAWADRLKKSYSEIFRAKSILQTLLDVTNELQSRFELSQERIKVAKRSKGIKSLPDELLAKIFWFSVWEMGRNGVKRAMELSQVSRWFRNVALDTRALWATLSSVSSLDQTKMLVSRAGPTETFHVFIRLDWPIEIHPFIEICGPAISRWKSLTLNYHRSTDNTDRALSKALVGLLSLFVESRLRSTSLEEIAVIGDRLYPHSSYGCTLTEDVQHWATNLRSLRCSYFLPSLSSPLSTISTLVIIHEIHSLMLASPLKMLLELLLKLPNLSTFELEAHEAHGKYRNEILPATECSTITTFRLQLPGFPLEDFISSNGSCIATLMSALCMPSLEELSISIGIMDHDENFSESESAKLSQRLSHLSRALLAKHSGQIKSLFFDLWIETYSPEEDVTSSLTLNIPFDTITYVPSVTISSFMPVIFSRRADDEDLRHTSDITSECLLLPELKFIGCEHMTTVDLRRTIGSLESLGVWSRVKKLTVQDCKHITREDALNLVGEDRLQYLEWHVELQRSRTLDVDDDYGIESHYSYY
ncbi:hypothetical protein SCHPADRAFT_1001042 [Schizopora paradoxa]|uniref:Uncharacterized protein n=1 Tax=Schizopora paradoxa TaxID=27342 RepID=A0A0H2RTX7_9AGAM|nr:hypothetical protein SCHPADRAFT_1001042 [Schizopora paradoxa]